MKIKIEKIQVDEEKGEITLFFTLDGDLYAKVIDCKELKESWGRYMRAMEYVDEAGTFRRLEE